MIIIIYIFFLILLDSLSTYLFGRRQRVLCIRVCSLAFVLVGEDARLIGASLSEACRRFCDLVDFIKSRKIP